MLFPGRLRKRLEWSVPPAPLFWRRISADKGIRTRSQRGDWELVLSARNIPYFIGRFGRKDHFYVSPLLEKRARFELAAFAAENRKKPKDEIRRPLFRDWPLAPLYVLPLVLWHVLISGPWKGVCQWQKLGSLDEIAVLWHGEWARLATSLTLHSGLNHLTGNLVFGAFFLALLGRLCGFGHAWLVTCAGGIIGNFASVLIHKPGYASVGFSTALFASVGAIAGILIWRAAEKAFMPAAAALAFLAMLGVEGANTDYGAHICGLGAGLVLGCGEGAAIRKGWRLLPQWLAAAMALAIPVWAWREALG